MVVRMAAKRVGQKVSMSAVKLVGYLVALMVDRKVGNLVVPKAGHLVVLKEARKAAW